MTMPLSSPHSTLPSLIDRALAGNMRPLEFYLREQSRLPGTRANLELLDDFSVQLAGTVREKPEQVLTLLRYLISDDRHKVSTNTPAEFVMMCGVTAFGACAAARAAWRGEVYELLGQYACSMCWRVREGAKMGLQRLLEAAPRETLSYLTILAQQGNYYQQRAALAAVSEPPLLITIEQIYAALSLHRVVFDRLHDASALERKREDFRWLRRALGYTVSLLAAAAPEEGFALMRTVAAWNDSDANWILRENLKKKRLAKYSAYADEVWALIT